jgi:putative ABC transport system ATP-binding protein
MPLIHLDDIGRVYHLGDQEIHAIRSVSIDIEAREYIALMGPSGSGKSTMMNILGCLDRPTSGSYLLDGKQVSKMSKNALARMRNSKIGFVFQNFNLLARTSSLENVMLPLLYDHKLTQRTRRKKAESLLDLVGLKDRMRNHPGQLSGGQQQRVAIARALVNEPAILMADEPTGNLDSRTSRDVMDIFNRLREETDVTILLVTHDAHVARFADRFLVMMDGEVRCDSHEYDDAIEALQERDD